jgi:hypothetical protein
LLSRGERRCLRSDLSQDLLRCFRSDTRNFDQTRDRILIPLHLSRRQLVQFLDVSVDQLDPVQMLGQQLAVDVPYRAGQRIHQRRLTRKSHQQLAKGRLSWHN